MLRLNTMNPRTKTLIGLVLVIFLFSGISILLMPQNTKPYAPYVADSPSPSGIKGFYSLLESNLSDQPRIWYKPTQELPLTDNNQLMVMIEPYNTFNSDETQKWIDWMEAGNHILLVSENPDAFFNLNVFWITEEYDKNEIRTITGFDALKGAYKGSVNSYVRLSPSTDNQLLLKDSYGPLAMSKKYDQGQLIVLLTPDWFTNKSILDYNHLDMLIPLFQIMEPNIIWFNDYIHGYENKPTVFEIYPKWFVFLFLQSALILLLWLWYKGKRFGPIETPREWVVRYGDERIRAIAAWNERGGFYRESLLTQAEFLLDTIKNKWGISPKEDNKKLFEAVEIRLPANRRLEWQKSWNGFQNILEKKKISHKDYLKWSKELEDMRKEVENK